MVNLFPELAGNAASGVGAAAGGLLGQLGGILSAPRRALWSALGGPESGAELMHKAFGLDPESFAGQALGMGAEMLGDPLTWAGGPLTRALGGAVGKSASKAAWLKGPEYAGETNKIQDMVRTAAGKSYTAPISLLKEPPETLARLAAEIPEGSSFLGAGGEGLALRTPQGGVIRMQHGGAAPPTSRINSPEMLQPHRNITMGGTRLEHLPMVQTEAAAVAPLEAEYKALRATPMSPDVSASTSDLVNKIEGTAAEWKGRAKPLADSALKRGLDPYDLVNPDNIALTSEGRVITHDPGAILPGDLPVALAASTALDAGQPGRIGSGLSRLLGGRGRLRDYLARGYGSGGAGQGIPF